MVVLLCLVANWSNAQTTQEEFNYCSKGYKIQIESGLDMKKGYSIGFVGHHFVGEIATEYKELYRENEEYPCAWILYLHHGGNSYYLCLPHAKSSQEIWTQYWTQFRNLPENYKTAVSWTLAKLAAHNGSI